MGTKQTTLSVIGCVLFLAACATPPQPQHAVRVGLCGDRATLKGSLESIGEIPVGGGGDRERGEYFELWEGDRTWSFVLNNRFGASCMVAAGTDWRDGGSAFSAPPPPAPYMPAPELTL